MVNFTIKLLFNWMGLQIKKFKNVGQNMKLKLIMQF